MGVRNLRTSIDRMLRDFRRWRDERQALAAGWRWHKPDGSDMMILRRPVRLGDRDPTHWGSEVAWLTHGSRQCWLTCCEPGQAVRLDRGERV